SYQQADTRPANDRYVRVEKPAGIRYADFKVARINSKVGWPELESQLSYEVSDHKIVARTGAEHRVPFAINVLAFVLYMGRQ
ncbi:MAG TPA: hypothetical protein VEZ90_06960, partial [Blastocatellia bacterium]|nr:hypothetical protein [Blastocatellia bacterium]